MTTARHFTAGVSRRVAVAFTVLAAAAAIAQQSFPSRPLRIIVPAPPA